MSNVRRRLLTTTHPAHVMTTTAQSPGPVRPTPSIEELGFRKADCSTKLFAAAEGLLFSYFFDNRRAYDPEKVLESPEAYYFPINWIGCSGYLVVKESSEIIPFGSYVGHEAHIWAYYQGISLASAGADRHNNLKILRVNDRERTIAVLKDFLNAKYVAGEVVPKLDALPLLLEDVDLYFAIRGLINARANGWFTFEVSKYPACDA
jgi:hypothetical protein